jgi:hypothetical protein
VGGATLAPPRRTCADQPRTRLPSGCHRGLLARTISECLLPHLQKKQPWVFYVLKGNAYVDHDFADIVCSECKSVLTSFAFRPEGAPGYAAPPGGLILIEWGSNRVLWTPADKNNSVNDLDYCRSLASTSWPNRRKNLPFGTRSDYVEPRTLRRTVRTLHNRRSEPKSLANVDTV